MSTERVELIHELYADPVALSELSVIGRCVLFPTTIAVALTKLQHEDFADPARAALFQCISILSGRGEAVELGTLTREMAARFPSIAFKDVVSLIVDAETVTVTGANMGHYAEAVKDHAIIRNLQRAGVEISKLTARDSSEAVVSAAQALIDGVGVTQTQDFVQLREAAGEVYERAEKISIGQLTQTLIPTGIARLDEEIGGIDTAQLIVIGARTSGGKSALGLQIIESVGKRGRRCLVFSLEMSKDNFGRRALSAESGVHSLRIKTGTSLDAEDWVGLRRAIIGLENTDIELVCRSRIHVDELRMMALRARMRGPIALMMIDYIQLVRPERGIKYTNREQEIANISRCLKSLTNELGTPIVALAQLNREVQKREDHWPLLSDLRESGSIEADADTVMMIHLPYLYSQDPNDQRKAGIRLAKQRDGRVHDIGGDHDPRGWMEFDPVRGRFA
jgi:replicative DNA helicase